MDLLDRFKPAVIAAVCASVQAVMTDDIGGSGMRKFKVKVDGVAYSVEVTEEGMAVAAAPVQPETSVTAPLPGKISKVIARAGQTVKKGEVLMLLEAMKMQNEIGAPAAGTVKSINVNAAETVKPGQVLAVIG